MPHGNAAAPRKGINATNPKHAPHRVIWHNISSLKGKIM